VRHRPSRRAGACIVAAVAAVFVLMLAAAAPAGAETVTVSMTGDPLTGSFSFRQDLVDILAGDVCIRGSCRRRSASRPSSR
jgi:hypothetical protein